MRARALSYFFFKITLQINIFEGAMDFFIISMEIPSTEVESTGYLGIRGICNINDNGDDDNIKAMVIMIMMTLKIMINMITIMKTTMVMENEPPHMNIPFLFHKLDLSSKQH